MTTWTTLPDAAVGPGGRPRGSTVTALRDNPVAISEGASGAPKVRTLALDPPAVGDVVIGRFTPTATFILGSGSNSGSGSLSISSEAFGYIFVAHILNAGGIRIKGTVSSTGSASSQSSWVAIYKNNVLVSSPTGTFSADVTVAVGDELRLVVQGSASTSSGGGNMTISIANLRICAAGAALWRS